MVGNNVSHANNKTKKRFLPNLHKRRLWHPTRKRFIRLRVSAQGLRLIDKYGIEAVLQAMETGTKIKKPTVMHTKDESATATTTDAKRSQTDDGSQEGNQQLSSQPKDQNDNPSNNQNDEEVENAR